MQLLLRVNLHKGKESGYVSNFEAQFIDSNGARLSKIALKTEFARGPGRGDTCHLSNLDETLPD